MPVTIQGPPRRRRGAAGRPDSPPLHRSSARWWALVGALWGLVSMMPATLPHYYYELVGYRLGRALTWLLPSWVTVRAFEALGIARVEPEWLLVGLVIAGAVALGTMAALVLWWLYGRGREVGAGRQR